VRLPPGWLTATLHRGRSVSSGTWGSFAPMLAAHLWKILKRPILYIAPHIDDADSRRRRPAGFCRLRPSRRCRSGKAPMKVDATDEILAQRLRTMSLWMAGAAASQKPRTVPAVHLHAGPQPAGGAADLLAQQGLSLAVGQTFEPDLAGRLADRSRLRARRQRRPVPGQFAHRGGIVDIFAPVCSVGDAGRPPT
jgi:transcription-repair coupling factor (superfamily II helicase)